MKRYLLMATLGVAVLLCAGLLLHSPVTSPEARQAQSMLGERWYRLLLDGRHVGYWHTRNARDESGNWRFESEQQFTLSATQSWRTLTSHTFAAEPPHPLIEARHTNHSGDIVTGVQIQAVGSGYHARRIPEEGSPPRILDDAFHLGDYMALERWLDEDRPPAGATRTVTTMDLARLRRINRTYSVQIAADDGYVIESRTPEPNSRLVLDSRLVPVSIRVAGLIEFERASRQAALTVPDQRLATAVAVPLDQRLGDPARIERITLSIDGHPAPQALFPRARQQNGAWLLDLQAGTLFGARAEAPLAETLRLPSRHPRIAALARQAIGLAEDDDARARALVAFVHDFVSYKSDTPVQGVLDVLDSRSGDCTEFADLLTTLARSQNIPARTVFGLAYRDGPEPAFAHHAWNELRIDGRWQAMDPTWNQVVTDATHIPLPADHDAALMLLAPELSLRFSVVELAMSPD